MSTATTKRPAQRGWIRRHRLAVGIAGQLIALALILWFLVRPQMPDAHTTWTHFASMDRRWFWAAIGAESMSLLTYTLASRALLPPPTRPSWLRITRVDLSAIALGHCVPDGGAAGTALSVKMLADEDVPAVDATLAKLMQGLAAAITLEAMVLAGLAVSWLRGVWSQWAMLPLVVSGGLLAVVILIWAALSHPALWALLHRWLRRVPRIGARLGDGLDSLGRRDAVGHLRALVRSPRLLWSALIPLSSNWVFDAITLWACMHAFGAETGLLAIVVAYALSTISSWVPITPSGLGVAESMMIPAMVSLGSPRAAAVAGILLWRLVAYWLPIPLGALAYASYSLRRRRDKDGPSGPTPAVAGAAVSPAERE